MLSLLPLFSAFLCLSYSYHLPCSGISEHSIDGLCYFFRSTIGSPEDQETWCQSWDELNLFDRSSHLASFHSISQEDYIFTNYVDPSGPSFIGLEFSLSGYSWLDGSSTSYLLTRSGSIDSTSSEPMHYFQSGISPYQWLSASPAPKRAICSFVIPTCWSEPGDDNSTCSGNGYCLGEDICVCTVNGTTGPTCSDYYCYGAEGNDTANVCYGHGSCVGTDLCVCDIGYDSLSNCSMKWCELTGCSGNGTCGVNSTGGVSCICSEGYGGILCENSVSCSQSCGSHGECADAEDFCRCDTEWSGSLCDVPSCNLVSNCSDHGNCTIGPNVCSCYAGFFGTECENSFAVCGPGEHVDISTFTLCLDCPEGYYCPDGLYALACPIGSYCNGTGRDSFETCTAGYVCSNGIDMTECGANGVYCPSDSLVVPTICPSGKFCQGPTTVLPEDCLGGYYCPIGSIGPKGQKHGDNTERICPEGCWCGTSSSIPTCPCQDGYYCPPGSSNSTFQLCPDSHFCTSGHKHSCPNGTEATGESVRIECDLMTSPGSSSSCFEGQFFNTVADECQVCPIGSYCPPNTPLPIPCSLGTFCNESGQSNYSTCSPGFVCDGWEQVECGVDGVYCPRDSMAFALNCPAGKYCSGPRTVVPQLCEGGYYCLMGSVGSRGQRDGDSVEKICPRGCFCDVGSSGPTCPCQDGYFCPEGSLNSTSNACPPNHYCLSGQKLECPNGTYAPSLFAPRTECMACPGGTCPNETEICVPGEYLDVDGVTCLDCPVGFYCPNDGFAHSCPPGTYCNGTRRSTFSSCSMGYVCYNGVNQSDCGIDGVYCPASGLSFSLPCPPGKHCPGPNTIVPLDCDPGFFCSSGSLGSRGQVDGDSSDKLCPLGCYCPLGSAAPVCPCDDGCFCDVGSSSADDGLCPAGFFCTVGVLFECANGTYADTPAVRTSCPDCPSGMVCATDSSPTNCPDGHYCPAKTLLPSQAIPCPSGCYCPLNSASPTCPCDEGYLCSGLATNQTSEPCPPGHYCSLGLQLPCPNGTYALEYSVRPLCTDCDAGFACPDATSDPIPCGNGTYCPAGTPVPNQCPEGCYCPAGSGSPTCPCEEGYFCPPGSSSSTAELCPIGKSCVDGLVTACPFGTLALAAGVRSECSLCPAGSYCPSPTNISTCPIRYFCPQGTDALIDGLLCPAGYACPVGTGSSTAGGLCLDGYNCPSGSSSHTQELCPPGFFCVNGLPRICPNGTFSLTYGARLTCDRCPGLQYCYGGSNYSCEGLVGVVCDPGSDRPLPCPEHYRCIDGAKELIEREQLEAEKEAAEEEAEEQKSEKVVYMATTIGTYSTIAAIVSTVVLALLAIGFIYCCFHIRSRHPIIPTAKTLTFAFTDILNSTLLHNLAPEAMKVALATHDALARRLLKKHNGYEVKTIGDSFFVTFLDPIKAVQWACDFQIELMRETWPEKILNLADCSTVTSQASVDELNWDAEACQRKGAFGWFRRAKSRLVVQRAGVEKYEKTLFSGLRVRIGLHVGSRFTTLFNRTWKTYDFIGSTINMCARIEQSALPGQVFLSSQLYDNVKDSISSDSLQIENAGLFRMKGFKGRFLLYAAVPALLAQRFDVSGRGQNANDQAPSIPSVSPCSPSSRDRIDMLFSPSPGSPSSPVAYSLSRRSSLDSTSLLEGEDGFSSQDSEELGHLPDSSTSTSLDRMLSKLPARVDTQQRHRTTPATSRIASLDCVRSEDMSGQFSVPTPTSPDSMAPWMGSPERRGGGRRRRRRRGRGKRGRGRGRERGRTRRESLHRSMTTNGLLTTRTVEVQDQNVIIVGDDL